MKSSDPHVLATWVKKIPWFAWQDSPASESHSPSGQAEWGLVCVFPSLLAVQSYSPPGQAGWGLTRLVYNNQSDSAGIVREFIDFLRSNKKWWLTPIMIVTLLLLGAALLLPSPVAPFIYSLF